MTNTPIKVQDLRRRIYLKAKADLAGSGGLGSGYTKDSNSFLSIGLTTTGRKPLRYNRSHNP